MRQYKSLFKESVGSLEVDSITEAKQIVDISNLVWGKTKGKMSWDKATSSCRQGWRLPTIQELYTAYVQKVPGFESNYYWSSSTHAQDTNYAWLVDFSNEYVNFYSKSHSVPYVRCVKEI